MSQAQRKQLGSARVRSVPPPLPRRSTAPMPMPMRLPLTSVPRARVSPPPPPLAALRSVRPVATQPRAPQLALVPQWEDANAPLQPAPKKRRRLAFWLAGAAVGIAAGALVAGGFAGPRWSQSVEGTRGLGPSQAVLELPVQVIEGDPDAPPEAGDRVLERASGSRLSAAQSGRAGQPKLTRAARRTRQVRARMSALIAAQPDPRAEAEARAHASAAQPAAAVASAESADAVSALPARLTREQVRSGLEALRPIVTACAAGARGTVIADVTITGAGRVSYAVIDAGQFAGTPAGSCMARSLRDAQFPAFSGETFKVRYPFAL